MSFPRYPEYKDSGVEWLGEVPAHWEVRRLRYVAELNPSKSEVRLLPAESSVSFIPMEAVGEDGSLSLDQTRPISEVLSGYTYVREGDVTIAKITPCFENGKGAVMRGLENRVGFGTTELIVMRPKASLATSNYLYRVVSSEPFRVLGESSMYGAGGQKRVPDDFVRNFTIAWPPYQEQAEIQAFLDHETARIDDLVEQQKRLIELLKEKRQAVISHAVTKGLDTDVPMKDSEVEWLGEVPAHWDVVRMRFLCDISTGDKDTQDAEPTGEYPFFVRSETIERSDSFSFEGEGVFTSGDGAGVGKIFHHFNGKCAIHQRVYLFHDFYGVTGRLFFHFLKSKLEPVVLSQSAKSTVDSLRLPMLQNFWMTRPEKKEQEEICCYIDKFEIEVGKLLEQSRKSITLLQERRSALISAAVTGKIDVRGWQPPAGSSVLTEIRQSKAV